MSDGARDGQTNTGIDPNNAGPAATTVDTQVDAGDGIDKNISKHLDIAIEAQDGKPEAKTDAKVEDDKTAETKEGEAKQPTDSQGATGDATVKPDPAKEASEAGRTLARAKDLTLKDGTVVRGGAERRFYEQRETARQEAAHLRQQLDNAQRELKNISTERDTIKQSVENLRGVDPKSLEIGARIVTDLQRDPVGTLKKLLAETVAQGYSIDDIGAGVDAAALRRMIDERLPAQTATGPTEEELQREALAEAEQFFSRYPDARPHDALIAQVMRDHPGVDTHTAYFQLKSAFAEKGFDWSLSLEDNLKAASGPITDNTKAQDDKKKDLAMPQSRGGADEDFKLTNGSGVVHEDTDTADIVKAAMRESGINI